MKIEIHKPLTFYNIRQFEEASLQFTYIVNSIVGADNVAEVKSNLEYMTKIGLTSWFVINIEDDMITVSQKHFKTKKPTGILIFAKI